MHSCLLGRTETAWRGVQNVQLSPCQVPLGPRFHARLPPHATLWNILGPQEDKATSLRQDWGLGPDSGNSVNVLKDLEGYAPENHLLDLQLGKDAWDRGRREFGARQRIPGDDAYSSSDFRGACWASGPELSSSEHCVPTALEGGVIPILQTGKWSLAGKVGLHWVSGRAGVRTQTYEIQSPPGSRLT